MDSRFRKMLVERTLKEKAVCEVALSPSGGWGCSWGGLAGTEETGFGNLWWDSSHLAVGILRTRHLPLTCPLPSLQRQLFSGVIFISS